VDRAALAFLDSDAVAMAALNLDADAAAVTAGAIAPWVPVPIRPAMHQRRITEGIGRDPQAGGRCRGHSIGGESAETEGKASGRGEDQSFTHVFLRKFFNEISRMHQRTRGFDVPRSRADFEPMFVDKMNEPSMIHHLSTIPWPIDRKVVELGVLTIDKAVPNSAEAEKKLLFLLTDGIEESDDPLIDIRNGAYALSFSRRNP
jgi:hypothetical protein